MHHKTRLVPTLLVGPDRTTQPDSATSASISSRSRRLFIFYTLCSLLHSRLPSPEPQPQSLRRPELTPTPPRRRRQRAALCCDVQSPAADNTDARSGRAGRQGKTARGQEPSQESEHAARHRSAHGDATATTCSSRRGAAASALTSLSSWLAWVKVSNAAPTSGSPRRRSGSARGEEVAPLRQPPPRQGLWICDSSATMTMMSHPSFDFFRCPEEKSRGSV